MEPSEAGYRLGDYELFDLLGQGSFGTVRKGIHVDSKEVVAVKIMSKTRLRRKRVGRFNTALDNAMREIQIWKTLDHQHVVKLLQVIDDRKIVYDHSHSDVSEVPNFDCVHGAQEGEIYLVCEFADLGTLYFDQTPKEEGGSSEGSRAFSRVSIDEIRSYFSMLMSALSYLHTRRVVHRDIKPSNLLLFSSKNPGGPKTLLKLADLGCGTHFELENEATFRATEGTASFLAPESLVGTPFSACKADLWASGITLYILLFGAHPFQQAESITSLYETICSFEISSVDVSGCFLSSETDEQRESRRIAFQLLVALLQRDPSIRISIEEAQNHPFLQQT
jgi:serine/threonine protein kinase